MTSSKQQQDSQQEKVKIKQGSKELLLGIPFVRKELLIPANDKCVSWSQKDMSNMES